MGKDPRQRQTTKQRQNPRQKGAGRKSKEAHRLCPTYILYILFTFNLILTPIQSPKQFRNFPLIPPGPFYIPLPLLKGPGVNFITLLFKK